MSASLAPWQSIREILSSKPSAAALLDRITHHFGNRLEFYFQETSKPESLVKFIRVPNNSELEKIVVISHPDPAAIVHECLHVKLIVDGFPLLLGEKLENQICYDAASVLQNQLSHAVFLDEFLSYGFDRMSFANDTFKSENIPEYERQIDACLRTPLISRFARGLWNRIYFEQLISDRLGFPNKRNEFLVVGRQRFSSMDADANLMATWFDFGGFRYPVLFPHAMNQILQLIGFNSVRWGHVNRVAGRLFLADIP